MKLHNPKVSLRGFCVQLFARRQQCARRRCRSLKPVLYLCVLRRCIRNSEDILWPPYAIGKPLYFCPVVSIYLMVALWNRETIIFSCCGLLWPPYEIARPVYFTVALCNRADHYIFWFSCCGLFFFFFFLSFFSSPNLSGRRLDVYHTCTHGVALVRI